MGRKRKHPFLEKRKNGIYRVYKTIRVGQKKVEVRISTGERSLELAEEVGLAILDQERDKLLYGNQHSYTFEDAAIRLLQTSGRNHENDIYHLDLLMPYLKDVLLTDLHRWHPKLEAFIYDRQLQGRKNNTINRSLEKVSVILNLATQWRDGSEPWLRVAPKINKLPRRDKQNPNASQDDGYALSLAEYRSLFTRLKQAPHIHDMALFSLHTGLREANVTGLKWEWEKEILGLDVTAFFLPDTKNSIPHIVLLNRTAREVIDRQRGNHSEYVFIYKGNPVGNIYNTAWDNAIRDCNLRDVRGNGAHFRVHDLRTTFSTWLRDVGVPKEDRQSLMAHSNQNITTHYSKPELVNLLHYLEKLPELIESGKESIYLAKHFSHLSPNAIMEKMETSVSH